MKFVSFLVLVVTLASAQTSFLSCLDLCNLGGSNIPRDFVDCTQTAINLNYPILAWGCNKATPRSMVSDVICGAGSVVNTWPGVAPNSTNCTWSVTTIGTDDAAQFVITWNATTLADLGPSPALTFQASVSSPPPPTLVVTLTSLGTNNLTATTCSFTEDLVAFTNNGANAQPQTYSYVFSPAACPAAFNPARILKFTMLVQGSPVPGAASSFTMFQTTSPVGPCFSTTQCPQPDFTVTKTTTTTSVNSAGTVIPYTITITNTGKTTLNNMQVTDSNVTGLTCTPVQIGGALIVGATTTCSGTRTVTQANMNAGGSLSNTVSVTFTELGPKTATASVPVVQNPGFTLTKTVTPTTTSTVGAVLSYTITISNIGNVDLTGFTLQDALLNNNVTCNNGSPGGTLLTGTTSICSGSYVVTQNDINTKTQIQNDVTVNFTGQTAKTASATTTLNRVVSFDVTKTNNLPVATQANQVISYTITVRNTGNADLSGMSVADALLTSNGNNVTCQPVAIGGTLAVSNPATTCTGTYTVTQANLNSGGNITNTATVSFTSPVIPSKSASSTTLVTGSPALSVTKSADRATVNAANQTITYTITIQNTGNVDLAQLNISDARLNPQGITCNGPGNGQTLSVGVTTVCTGRYTTTQQDILNGAPLVNTVTVTTARTSAQNASATVNVQQTAMFTITKTTTVTTVNAAGRSIPYTITVANTGTMRLTNFAITDPLVSGGTGQQITCTPPLGGALNVSQTAVCSGSYVTTQADINAGTTITNVATARFTEVGPLSAQVDTSVLQSPGLTISKTATPASVSTANTAIQYSIVVTNVGNVDLNNYQLSDPLIQLGANNLQCQPAIGSTINVGSSATCTGTYVVTQSDLNNVTSITNVASASARQVPTPLSATVTTPLVASPAITITKTASVPSVDAAGTTISYQIVISNTGNVDLGNLALQDPLITQGQNNLACSPVTLGSTLPVGSRTTCTGSYIVTAADMSAGTAIVNVATVSATRVPNASANATTLIVQKPSFGAVKAADVASVNAAGNTINYSITVTNTGNIALTGMNVVDSRIPSLNCQPFALGANLPTGQNTVCRGVYTVTQSDINAGVALLNTANVSFTNPNVQPQTVRATVNVVQVKAFNVTKSVNKTTTSTAGDVLGYTIVISNTGNTDLLNLAVTDPLITGAGGSLTCSPIAVGQTLPATTGSTTCRGTYTTTQSNINSGANIVNTVTVNLGGVNPQDATATTTVTQNRALSITKTPSVNVVDAAGQIIRYTIVVRNVGNVDLNNLTVSDQRLSTTVVCAPVGIGGTLPVAGSTTCSGSYTVLQSDINAGVPLLNTATAAATQTAPVSAIATVNVLQNAMLTANKTVNLASVSTAGTVLRYTISVTNTGNEDLTNLQIQDPLISSNANDLQCNPVAIGSTLTVTTKTTTCTGSYTVKQSDINAGFAITNNATVTTTQAGPVPVQVTTTVVRSPSLTINKAASRSVVNSAGQVINYSVTIINTGNTDLTNMQVDDVLIDTNANNLACSPVAKGATLGLGATTTCLGSYTVTQANINSGNAIVNTAGVTTGQTARTTADVTTTVTQNPAFTVTKAASVAQVTAANQQIQYTIVITNIGNVDLSNLQVSDTRLTSNLTCGPVPVGSTLSVAQPVTTCTGSYTTSQADINAAQPLVNTVTVRVNQVQQAQTASATVNVLASPKLTLTKAADRPTVNAAGQQITYSLVITNTGNQDLQNLQLSDSLIAGTSLRCAPVALGQTLTVSTGATTCTGVYTVTQADINRGTPLINTAVAQTTQTTPVSAQATVNIVAQPAFTISKTVSSATATFSGQRLLYSIVIRNTGNQDLTNFNLQDPLITGGQNDLSCNPVSRGQTLTVAAPVTTCTGSYVVTQTNINSGSAIVNTATASFQQAQPQSASVSTTIGQNPAMTITKTPSVASVSQLGQVITYTIVVANVGNMDLTSLSVVDTRVTGLSCSNVSIGSTLPVNASTTCTGAYATTQADINAGAPILNTATASSTQTRPISAVASVDVNQNARFNVTKTASLLSVNQAGQVIQYAIQITNTGNEDLLALRVSDPFIEQSPGANDLRCSPVAVGQTLTVASPRTTCTGSYVVSQANINAGSVLTNIVTVAFTQTPAQTAVANTNVVRSPSFSITKSASLGTVNAAGQTIRYSIIVTNRGNTDLTNFALSDFLIETSNRDLSCSPVAPGQTLGVGLSTTCTGSYTVTQANINAGTPIVNTASAQFSEAPSQSASATTTVTQSPTFTITKTADRPSVDAAGQIVNFTITVSNTGNVDLLNFQLSDPLVDSNNNNIRCSPVAKGSVLTVTARSTVCTGSYVTKQADINAGNPIVNVATAQFSNAPSLSAQVSIAVTTRPLLSITKAANRPSVNRTGDVISYAIVVTNQGNVDLTNLQVRDSRVDAFANDLRCSPVAEGQILGVGIATTCTGTYVTTQSDINAGVALVNTASAVAGNAPEVSASASVNVNQSPSFTITKRANVESVNAAGNVISWTVVVVNTGNMDLTRFALADPLVDSSTNNMVCSPTAVGSTLAVASPTTTCVGTYIVSQADVNNKTSIVNTATASFTQAAPASASATVIVVASPAMSITKVANPTIVDSPGDVITYTITVSNIGNVDLPNLNVSDPRIINLSCAPIAIGQTLPVAQPVTRCTGTYITTQQDINAGSVIVNTATATSSRTAAVTARASVNVRGVAMFDVTKTADKDTVTAAGQSIRYTISITNTGTVDLNNLQVADPLITTGTANTLTCSPVAIGQTLTVAAPNTLCTGSYIVTQADMDRGDNIVNIVTVNTTQFGPKSAQVTTVVSQRPSFTVRKTADLGVVSVVNTTIRYTIVVTNTGNVGLLNLQVADDLIDNSRQALTCQPVPEGTTLAVGASTTCTGGYVVTQDDLNRGTDLVNTATVTTTNFGPLSSSATTRIQQLPSLTVRKTGDKTQVDGSGQTITYEVVITNTGNIDLTNLQVADALIDNSSNNLVCFPVAEGATLTVRQPVTRCTGTYTTKQTDINAGLDIVNTAVVTTVQTNPISDSFTTRVVQRPLVTVTKSADRPTVADDLDVILYTIVVKNVGNMDLTSLQILDPLIDTSTNNLSCSPVSRDAGVLLFNQTTTCSGTYVVPQSAINVGGQIRNEVSVKTREAAVVSAFVVTPIIQRPSIQVTKTADRLTVNTAGQVIRFSITVLNTGNMDLNNLQVTDNLVDLSTNDLVCSPVGRGQTLTTDLGMTVCTGSYIVTQSDINAGGVIQNVVSVSSAQTPAVTAQSNTIVAQNPRLIVSKTADPITVSLPGQTITYRISVSNGGNVDLTSLSVSDAQVDGVLTCAPIALGANLPVGSSTVCTGSKVVTQAMIDDASPIVNTATAKTVQAGPVSALATVNIAQKSMLTVRKTASVGQVDRAGQNITFTIFIQNAGTVELTNLQVSDPLLSNNVACTPVSAGGTLGVGASTTCVGTYTVTQTVMNLGANIVNEVFVQTSQVGPVRAMAVVSVAQAPSFSVAKTASPTTVTRVGQNVTFSIVIRNTGNVDLDNVQVVDRMIDLFANNLRCTPQAEGTTLTVANPTTTCTGTYTVTQSDMNSGLDIVNFVSVNSNQFGPVTARATVSVNQTRSLTVVKSSNVQSVTVPGQIITWSLVITNTGNTDLDNLQVLDPLIDNSINNLVCSPVRQGSSLTVSTPTTTCSGTYVTTQQDFNSATSLTNTASVTATGVGPVTASATVQIVQRPSFTVEKTADRLNVTLAGQVILYNVIVRNTGNMDLPNLQISDPLIDAGLNNLVCTPVPKGGILTVAIGLVNCTGSYVVKQAEINAGAPIVNTATVSFSGVTVAPVTANVTTAVIRSPSLSVLKEADRFSVNAPGQVISYEIFIANTGNVDLPNLQVNDPLVGSTLSCAPVAVGGTLTVASPQTNCTGRYTVTQADLNSGRNIVNVVSVQTSLTSPITANATTFLTQTASLTISKTAGVDTVSQPGQTIPYSIVVRNTGNVAQTGLVVTDNKVPSLSCTPSGSDLPAGGVVQCVGTYTVTTADINAGVPIVNVAVARTGQAGPVNATASVNVFSFAQFTATKTANVSSVSSAGTVVGYTVVVRNTGTVALTNLAVVDPLIASMVCAPVAAGQTLARGNATTCTGSYTVTQTDINRGVPIVNTVSVAFSNAGTVLATASVGVNSVTAFTVTKVGTPSTVTAAGQTVLYNVTVVNTGSADLSGFQINDPPVPNGFNCAPVSPGGTLARGATTVCTASYTVTSGDVSRGNIVNVVTVTLGGLQRTASFVVNVQGPQTGQLTLTKTASTQFVSAPGQNITYTLIARNTGLTPLLNVFIADPLLPVLTCLPVPNGQALAAGALLNCTGVLTVTQAQFNSGFITNTATATATGLPPVTATVTVIASATSGTLTTVPTTTPSTTPIIFFAKRASPTIVTAAGQQITYTITATNGILGNINNVVISDPSLPLLQCNPPQGSTLASGTVMTCTGVATVTQQQISAGQSIVNTATVTATGLTSIVQAKATVQVAASGTFGVAKSTTATSYSVAGQRIPYTISVLNNLNVAAVYQLSDPLIDQTSNDLVCSPVPRGATLQVGQTTVCTGTYQVTNNDVILGQPIVNQVIVTSPAVPGVTFTASVSTPKSNQGQLVFQLILVNGVLQLVPIVQRDEFVHTHAERATDLSSVQLRITDSTGAVYYVFLDANGFFTGTFAPGLAEIYIIPSTLPAGVTILQGSNPLYVTIPSNGIVGGQIVLGPTTVLAGHIYNDVNGNGVQDVGEPNIQGATVRLQSTAGSAVLTTNSTGDWAAGVTANVVVTATVDTTTLGLGANPVLTQGTNPTPAVVAQSSTFVIVNGFRAGTTPTTTPPTTAPPTPPLPTETTINFYFSGILKGATGGCGCSNNKK